MVERKCLKCGTWNGEEKFCNTCSAALAPEEIIKEEDRKKALAEASRPPDGIDRFVLRLKASEFLPARIVYYLGYSVTAIFVAIGSFLAWIVAMSQG